MLQYSRIFYSILQYSTVFYSVLQYSIVFYSILQCSKDLYSILQYSTVTTEIHLNTGRRKVVFLVRACTSHEKTMRKPVVQSQYLLYRVSTESTESVPVVQSQYM